MMIQEYCKLKGLDKLRLDRIYLKIREELSCNLIFCRLMIYYRGKMEIVNE